MSTVRVGLVSDSHGRFECLSRMADSAPDVAAWIHPRCLDFAFPGCRGAVSPERRSGDVYAHLG